jgi:hypothetical protein
MKRISHFWTENRVVPYCRTGDEECSLCAKSGHSLVARKDQAYRAQSADISSGANADELPLIAADYGVALAHDLAATATDKRYVTYERTFQSRWNAPLDRKQSF